MLVNSITIESLYSLLYHIAPYMMDILMQQVKEFQKEYEAMVRKFVYISHFVLCKLC